MTRKRIEELRAEVAALRARPKSIRASDVIAIAESIGRKRKKKRRGDPAWAMPGSYPISIPCHPGTLSVGTARNILNSLDADLDALEATLDEQAGGNNGANNGNGSERRH